MPVRRKVNCSLSEMTVYGPYRERGVQFRKNTTEERLAAGYLKGGRARGWDFCIKRKAVILWH